MTPPISIDGTDITGATIDGTDVQEITVDGDVVFSAGPTPFTEGFEAMSIGQSLDGFNGWFDNPDSFFADDNFTGDGNQFNTPGIAIGSPVNSAISKGQIGRNIPNQAYTDVSFFFGIDGSGDNKSVFVSLRQNGSDIIRVEIDDDGDGDDADTIVNNTLIVDSQNESQGEIGNDFIANLFDFTIDYNSGAVSGSVESEKTGFSVSFNEPLLSTATGIDEIYLWRTGADGMLFDELDMR